MSTSRLRALLLAAATLAANGPARAEESSPTPRPSSRELSARLEQVSGQLNAAEDNLRFVETRYTARTEPGDEGDPLRRFSAGEIQYLLGDWAAASVLFYDLVSDPGFRAHPHYVDALFLLSDSLYQQRNYVGARLYLRQLLTLPDTHRYKDALVRYVEIASRLNQFTGLEEYLERARSLSGGKLVPELEYVYGKWLFKRPDLPEAERREQARAAFQSLADTPGGPFQKQSAYFLGVLSVQEGDHAGAVERFRPLAASTSDEPELKRLEELANLSLGRLLFELGRHDEALARYETIPRDSESFVDSLYERAWVYVKKEDFEKARNATDLLLLVAPESPLAPEARLLQGHLQLKLRRYDEATATYEDFIGTYKPVRDQIDVLLATHKDPIAYFGELLARNELTLDVTTLLPAMARPFATTHPEVADSVAMVKDVESSRQGVEESRTIATRILQALDERGPQLFPELQEGYLRAESVDSALARAEQILVQVEGAVLWERLTLEERTALNEVRRERQALEARFASIPTNEAELEARRRRMQARVDELDREAFRLGYELQGLSAVAASVRKWVEDTRGQGENPPEEAKELLEPLSHEEAAVVALQAEVQQLRARLGDERGSATTFVSGEEVIREQYRELLGREHALLAAAEGRLSGDDAALVGRSHEARQRAEALGSRVDTALRTLRAEIERRGREVREKVLVEQQHLQAHGQEVAIVAGDMRHLVGRIAFESFQKVRQQFYDFVLKADVGLVDVGFTRKQDKTTEIQKLSAQKEKELRALEEELKVVIEDAY